MSARDARTLGFNDSVTVGGCELHVQTEVMGRQDTVICTTVLEHGVVRVAEKQVLSTEQLQAVDLQAVVQAQHQRHLAQLREAAARGTY